MHLLLTRSRVFMFNDPALIVGDPELVKHILVKDFYLFRNRRKAFVDNKEWKRSMFFARDEDWKRVRSIASPTFTSGKMKKMYSLIRECVNDYIEDLDTYAEKKAEIDLKEHHGSFTMDVIARCAFATKTNTHKD